MLVRNLEFGGKVREGVIIISFGEQRGDFTLNVQKNDWIDNTITRMVWLSRLMRNLRLQDLTGMI
ncbi:hypothetical protein BG261_08590 [Floricoccus tropicus]|uniref:Uncharacterized protein n=1 Tax=Floricoccus tropicus TaxID=1859473 RepID=A0A1E8GJA5_9LACT|nr:hypothetical protein [Floricoccus tropicus]OFI48329.1 hypothetical protein BG261_08590 [Floricoccus tropicus]